MRRCGRRREGGFGSNAQLEIPRYAKRPDGRFCDTTVFYKALAADAPILP